MVGMMLFLILADGGVMKSRRHCWFQSHDKSGHAGQDGDVDTMLEVGISLQLWRWLRSRSIPFHAEMEVEFQMSGVIGDRKRIYRMHIMCEAQS